MSQPLVLTGCAKKLVLLALVELNQSNSTNINYQNLYCFNEYMYFYKVGVCDVDLLLGKDVFTFMFILCLFCIIAIRFLSYKLAL